MSYLIGLAYTATVALILYRRLFIVFPVYLTAELIKWALYEPGLSWYVYLEFPVLALRCAAVIEAWWLLTWTMPLNERRHLGLVGIGMGGLAVALTLAVWPVDPDIGAFNQVRLACHLIAVCGIGTAVTWLSLHPVRQQPVAIWHAITMTAYVGMFTTVSIVAASWGHEWGYLRGMFQAGVLTCLTAWFFQQLLQHRNPRP